MTKEHLKAAPGVALVTGAGKRIGRALALGLGARGWAVAVHYGQSAAEAEAVVEQITANGGQAQAFAADLRDESQVQGLVGQVTEALGPVRLLVNNASLFELDTVADVSRESWDSHMQVNLRSPFVLIQEFAQLLPTEDRGNVVNIIDQRVWNLTPHFTSYTLSKAGLWTLTQTLAMALAPRIRVNAIGPGPTMASSRQSEAQFRAQYKSIPLEKATEPDEILNGLLYILSASAMTGQMIALDGGQHLGWGQVSADDLPED